MSEIYKVILFFGLITLVDIFLVHGILKKSVVKRSWRVKDITIPFLYKLTIQYFIYSSF